MGFWDKATDIWHDVTGIPTEDEKRNARRAANDQLKLYKEQSELTRKEIERKRGEEVAEKRRVESKQIRSLRRNYSSRGLMTNQDPGMSSKLGG